MQLITAATRDISRDLMDDLERAFPVPKITSADDLKNPNQFLWDSAQHQVVEWLRAKVNIKGVGPPNR